MATITIGAEKKPKFVKLDSLALHSLLSIKNHCLFPILLIFLNNKSGSCRDYRARYLLTINLSSRSLRSILGLLTHY